MEVEILEVLKEIRGLLFVFLISFSLLFVLIVLSTVTIMYMNIKDRLKVSFTDRAKELFEKKKYKEIIRLSEKELKVYPRSAEANWWLARVYTELGNDLEALKLFRKVTQLEPTWEAEYVSQYVKEINERINNR